jgi:hypothetical protein
VPNNFSYEEPRSHRGLQIAGAVIALVLFLLVVKPFSGSSGGLLGSSGNCSTQLHYGVPHEQLKGVKTSMDANRCTGTDSITGNPTHYVQLSLTVHGSTNDKSNVQDLNTAMRLERQSSGGWKTVTPTDIPKDSGVSISGSNVGYEKQVRWDVPHVPARATVVVSLKTDKGKPVRAVHVFMLP